MLRLAGFSIRRPVFALGAWVIAAAVLIAIGMGVERQLSPSITTVAGTESSRAHELADERFGPGALVPILLRGPAAQLDRQGPVLVRRLARRGDTRVLSAWDGGETAAALRPRKDAAMIVASVARSEEDMVAKVQDEIEATVRASVSGGVRSHVTGQPAIDIGLKDAAIDATRRSALIAAPILFLILLLVLRRPIAALVVAAFGGVTALVGVGVMALMGKVVEVDAAAVALGSMSGMALGAGFALVVLYRFLDEEAPRGAGRAESALAAAQAVDTSGRAVLFGGTAVIACLILAVLIAPTAILASLGIGVLVCSMIGVGGAVVVMPALLVLMGHHLEAGHRPAPRFAARPWNALVGAGGLVTRHAVLAGAAATAVLLGIAVPLSGVATGPPDVSQLPASSEARKNFEAVSQVMGPGWATPFNVLVVSERRPVTDTAMLRELDRLQRRIARDERVASVTGPGAFRAQTRDLAKLPVSLEDSAKLLKGGKRDLGRLEQGLGEAGAGTLKLRSGLRDAAAGAGKLGEGSGDAKSGAAQLRAGLAAARSGAREIESGLGSAVTGARSLRDGAGKALTGSRLLAGGLAKAEGPLKEGAPGVKELADGLGSAVTALGALGAGAQSIRDGLAKGLQQLEPLATDPRLRAVIGQLQAARDGAGQVAAGLAAIRGRMGTAATGARSLATQTAALTVGLAELRGGADALAKGIGALRSGNAELTDGLARLKGGGGELTAGLTKLRDGAGELEDGLGRVTGGTGQLAAGLSAGDAPAGRLAGGLGELQRGVAEFRGNLPSPKDLERLQQQSPGLFDSGYFVLAAIEGAVPAQRNQATFAVNLERGGDAGQIVVVPRYPSKDERTRELATTLQGMAATFAGRTGAEAAVGGPAGDLADFNSETGSRIWLVVAALAGAVALMLMAMLRTVVLPLVAVAFNLMAAAATFGILQLVFKGDDPLLGGPGYLDPMSVIGIFAAVFGVSMVYQVLLLARTREEYMRTGDPDAALSRGLSSTAGTATGAALAMLAVVVPFAISDLISVRQFALGLAIVIALDALIVRPVLLPAAVQLLGRWSWWPSRSPAEPPAAPVHRGRLRPI